MCFPSPTPTTKSFLNGAQYPDPEFELLADDGTDFGLSQLQLDGLHGQNSYDGVKVAPGRSGGVEDIRSIRARRQGILSKYISDESQNPPLPAQVKIFFTSRLRPCLAVLQSGDGVVEHDFSPNIIRVLPESLIFWSKGAARYSSGFFIQPQLTDEVTQEHDVPSTSSSSAQALLESNPQKIDLFTPSSSSDTLLYWGTVQIISDTLPDLHEQEFRVLPRTTQKDFYYEEGPATKNVGSLPHKIKCIGFRRLGVDPVLNGKFDWCRQRLSPAAREYLLARRTDPDLLPIADIPKTARRIRRLPKILKTQPAGASATPGASANIPITRLKFKPTIVASTAQPRNIQNLADDFDALNFEPPIFRASKRKRDERSNISITGDREDVNPSEKARELRTAVGVLAEGLDSEQKSNKKERKMKKSKARRKQDKEVKKIAAVLDGLSLRQLDSDKEDGMEALTTSTE